MAYVCSICVDQWEIQETQTSEKNQLTGLNISTLICGHIFHSSCLQPWFEKNKQRQCPVCRQASYVCIELHPSTSDTTVLERRSDPEPTLQAELNTQKKRNELIQSAVEVEKQKCSNWKSRCNEYQDELFKFQTGNKFTKLQEEIEALKKDVIKYKTLNETLISEIALAKSTLENCRSQIYLNIDRELSKCVLSFKTTGAGLSSPAIKSEPVTTTRSIPNEKVTAGRNLLQGASSSVNPNVGDFRFSDLDVNGFLRSFKQKPMKASTSISGPTFATSVCNCIKSLCGHGNCGCKRKGQSCSSLCFCQTNGNGVCHNPNTQ